MYIICKHKGRFYVGSSCECRYGMEFTLRGGIVILCWINKAMQCKAYLAIVLFTWMLCYAMLCYSMLERTLFVYRKTRSLLCGFFYFFKAF